MKVCIIFFILLPFFSQAVDNGLGLTPQMGWNSWNHFACNINETLIKQTADLLISTGLADKGYKYVNLDDCWQVNSSFIGIDFERSGDKKNYRGQRQISKRHESPW